MTPWQQVNITFPDWDTAEHTAVTHLRPLLAAAEADQAIASWFFLRKAPCWRLRYLPHGDTAAARAYLSQRFAALVAQRHLGRVTEGIVYEPEVQAFGGDEAMECAHRLFAADSRHLLAYLDRTEHAHRRELSILLCTAMLRGAGRDWYEQGDVWVKVAAHRPTPTADAAQPHALHAGIRRLMSVDTTSATRDGTPLAFASDWAAAYTATGRELARLHNHGLLHRGLRAVLAHHVIFAWNRAGLPATTQALLADTATTIVFGPDPTTAPHAQNGDPQCPARG